MNIPEKEWRSKEAHRLQQAEQRAGGYANRRRLLVLVVVLVFLGLLALSALSAPTPAELRQRLPYASDVLDTHSMEPELFVGDRITVRELAYSSIGIGSRVVRMDAWRKFPVCHVIVRNDGTAAMPRWVTQGINNKSPDHGWLLEDNYVGVWSRIGGLRK